MARGQRKEKPKPATIEMGGNIKGFLDDIAKARDQIEKIDEKIKALQADKKAIRENMEAKGIVKLGFDDALKYFRLDPKKREGYDQAYLLAREGMGLPVKGAQADLFNDDNNAKDKANGESKTQADTETGDEGEND